MKENLTEKEVQIVNNYLGFNAVTVYTTDSKINKLASLLAILCGDLGLNKDESFDRFKLQVAETLRSEILRANKKEFGDFD